MENSKIIKGKDGVRYYFPKVRGESEEQIAEKKEFSYHEIPEWEGSESSRNFCCGNCPYFTKDTDSPTGYHCEESKSKFFDVAWACCDKWRLPKSKYK